MEDPVHVHDVQATFLHLPGYSLGWIDMGCQMWHHPVWGKFHHSHLTGWLLAIYIGSCHKGLEKFPDEVRELVLTAIDWAEIGERHPATKVLQGFGGARVLEVVDSFKGDAYRFVYTTKFENAVYGCTHSRKNRRTGSQPRRRKSI